MQAAAFSNKMVLHSIFMAEVTITLVQVLHRSIRGAVSSGLTFHT